MQAGASAATAISVAILLAASVLGVSGLQCPPCGNQSVPYPLSTSSDCGHPNYKLSCTAAQSQLQLHTISGSYSVLDITSSAQLLVLAPASFLQSNGNASCISQDLGAGGFVLDQSQPFSVTSANSIILLNCSQILLQSPLNCSSSSPCHEAVMAAHEEPCRSLLCCSIGSASSANQFSIPLNASACSAYTSVVSLDPSVSAQGWDFGIQLRWQAPSEPPCTNQSQCTRHSVCSAANGDNGNLTCLCESGYVWDPFTGLCNEDAASKHRTALITALTPSLCAALIASLVLTAAICRRRRARNRAKAKVSEERSRILSVNGAKAALFSGRDMKKATDNFSKERLLGSGGFGEVYMGVLDDGTVVAIKVAKLGNVKGNEQVLNEVRILSQVNHRNLVRLLGCCVETEQPLMVYEYVPNGSLFEHLAPLGGNGRENLNWQRRMGIALETAEGLAYLHSSAYPPIIHRDVKSSNILLDAHLTAKVSDFGLSRLVEPDLTHVSTCAQGTLGYLDPQYYRNYQLTDKSDVYSFGVVLLELVTSQRAIDFTRDTDDVNLAVYVGDRAARGQVDEVLDPVLVGTASYAEIASMKTVVFLALDCLKENGGSRPRMKEVADQLHSILQELGIDRYSLSNK